MAEDVSADGLDDVFYKFWSVGFDAFPLFICSYAFVGDGFPAETVFSDAWFDVAEVSARGQVDKQDAAFVLETDAADLSGDALPNGGFYGTVYIPPELYNVWVGVSPGVDKELQFLFF